MKKIKKNEFKVSIELDKVENLVWVWVTDSSGREWGAYDDRLKYISDLDDKNIARLTREAKRGLLDAIKDGTYDGHNKLYLDRLTEVAYKVANPRE